MRLPSQILLILFHVIPLLISGCLTLKMTRHQIKEKPTMRRTLSAALLIVAALSLPLSHATGRNINYMSRGSVSGKGAATKVAAPVQKTREVKVYLVAVGDNGKTGKKIGCEDSLVPVTRTIKATKASLKAALVELVSIPHEYNGGLGNYVFGPDLKVRIVSISRGTATIRFAGHISVAGVCDVPRITEQIEATAKQFPTVKRVQVFVGKRRLADAIR
jgi:spore germination protein GerM